MFSKSISITFVIGIAILPALLYFFPVLNIEKTLAADTVFAPASEPKLTSFPIGKLSNDTESGIKPTEIKSWLDNFLDGLKSTAGVFVDFSKRSGGRLLNPILNLFKTNPADRLLEEQKQELTAIKKEIQSKKSTCLPSISEIFKK